jgi:CHAT domain-containing protein
LKRLAAGAAALCLLAPCLQARLIQVPAEYATIKAAVYAARAGDVIEVEDGVYFEENIPLTQRLTIRARHPYAAIIYGRPQSHGISCIFLVQAEADIGGFILKNSGFGILQRSSPDVGWTAHELAILNMSRAAVSINERGQAYGSASLIRILADNCSIGFQTDDARSLEVRRSLVANCGAAFSGCNHRSFQVEETMVWNCGALLREGERAAAPGQTNHIALAQNVSFLTPAAFRQMGRLATDPDILRTLNHLQKKAAAQGLESRSRDILGGIMYWILGDVCAMVDKPDQALAFYGEALDIGRSRNFPELVWPAHQGMANVFRSLGRTEDALEQYESAIQKVEAIRQDLIFKLYNPGYLADKIRLYESLIGLLYELHVRYPDRGYEHLAFEYSERSKARGLIQSLKEADLIRSSGAAHEFRGLERTVIHRMEVLQARLESPTLSPSRRAALLVDLDIAEQDLKSLFFRIREKAPEFGRLPYAEAYSLKDIRARLLDGHSLLIEYFLGETQSFAFGLTRDRLIFVHLADPRAIADLTDRFLRYLNARTETGFPGAAGSRKLYQILLSPFEPLLSKTGSPIFIVPDGMLYYLPFEALSREVPHPGPGSPSPDRPAGRYLVEDHEVSYGPSASTLIAIRERPRRPSGAMDFLGVANSWMNGQRTIAFPISIQLPPLKYAEREVETAASFFPKDRVRLLRGEFVDERAFLEQPLGQFRIIHFATHGLFDDSSLLRSCLLLGRDRRGDTDGFLQLQNIYLLELNADLVVLSACHTGLGRLEKGEGLAAMALAFLYAGSRSFLCSLWSVNDRFSVQFMKTFYARLAAGWTPSAALREAKLDMLGGQGLSPFYWAGFLLISGSDGSSLR